MAEQGQPKTLEELRRQVEGQQQPTALTAGTVQMPGIGYGVDPEEVSEVSVKTRPNGFVAADEVPDTRYDLGPYVEAQGEIPQPSNQRWNKYLKSMAGIAAEQAEIADLVDRAGARAFRSNPELMASVTDTTQGMLDQSREAVADLCNGHPTKSQLNKLPDHVFQSFQVWVQGLFGPKA